MAHKATIKSGGFFSPFTRIFGKFSIAKGGYCLSDQTWQRSQASRQPRDLVDPLWHLPQVFTAFLPPINESPSPARSAEWGRARRGRECVQQRSRSSPELDSAPLSSTPASKYRWEDTFVDLFVVMKWVKNTFVFPELRRNRPISNQLRQT